MAWQMKLLTYVVLLLQMGSGILAMVAFFSDYWGVVPAIPAHFGLTRICTERSGCDLITVSGAGSVFFLLLVAFLLGFVLALTCAIMELIRTYACFGFLTVVSLLQALMSFAGMVHSVVVFNAFYGSEFYYSWSFALGWLCVVTSVISGALCIYLYKKDPEMSEATAVAIAPYMVNVQYLTQKLRGPPKNTENIAPPTV